MSIIFVAIIFFMSGVVVGTIIGLFIACVGRNNEKYEYYDEGFIDGYTKAKGEVK